MSRTASQWNVNVEAPDLSNVMKQARSLGRNTAAADFYDELYKKQQERDEARAKEKKEKEDAKEDLGNEPESEGFWSKMGDFALGGLERTMDVLSRFNYASANATQSMLDNAQENRGENYFSRLGSDFGNIPEALSAGWEGFTGREKTTFADPLKDRFKELHGVNNLTGGQKFRLGTAGFIFDVALDPTTYIGLGLITKPARALRKMEDGDLHHRAKEISQDIAALPPVGRGPDGNLPGDQMDLSAKQIYTVLTGRAITAKGRGKGGPRVSRQAERAAITNQYINNVQAIKQQIRKNPDISPEHAKKFDLEIDQVARQYQKELNRYGNQAYRHALKAFDESKVKKLENVNLLAKSDSWTSVGKIANAFQSHHFWRMKPDDPRNLPFDEAMGKGWKEDSRLTNEQRAEILRETERAVKKHPKYRQISKAAAINSKELKHFEHGAAVAEAGAKKGYQNRIQGSKGARAQYNRQMNLLRAHVFMNVLRRYTGDEKFLEKFKDIEPLLERQAEIRKQLDDVSSANPNTTVKTTYDFENRPDKDLAEGEAPESIVSDEVIGLRQELKELEEVIDEKVYLDQPTVGTPKGFDREKFSFTEKWLATNKNTEFGRVVKNAVDSRTKDLHETKIATWKRENREKLNAAFKDDQTLEVGFPSKYTITKSEFKDTVLNNPDDVAIGFAWNIPLRGTNLTWKEAKLIKDDPVSTDEWKAAFRAWVEDAGKKDAFFNKTLDNAWKRAAYARNFSKVESGAKKLREQSYEVPKSVYNAKYAEARKEAISEVEFQVKKDRLKYFPDDEFEFVKKYDPKALNSEHSARIQAARLEYADKIRELKLESPSPRSNAAKLKEQIVKLEAERDQAIDALKAAHKEAMLTREAMADRLDEQLLLDLLDDVTENGQKYLSVGFAGKHIFDAPVPQVLTSAVGKMSGLPVLRSANKAWAEAFHPASKLSPELNEARLRSQGRVNDILKHHLDEIFHAFNKYPPEKRRAAFQSLIKGVPTGVDRELYDQTESFFADIVKYTNGTTKVGEYNLSLLDMNKYLPDEFKFLDRNGKTVRRTTLNSPSEIIEHMRRLRKDRDPMETLWHLRIAAEKAQAELATKHTIATTYGVRRVRDEDLGMLDGETLEVRMEQRDLIEALHDKHGWVTVDGFEESHYFAREAADEIEKLMEMLKPERTQEVMRIYDKALRAWKSTVTVYNPGYYSRNAIGEIIMGAFDGVKNPKWYDKAGQVLRHTMPDEVNDTLKSLTPWEKHVSQGGRKIVKLRNGKELSIEDVWVLYHEHNLKSGFISTEFDHYFPAASTARATPVGQVATKINDKVRQKGEKFEDFFRLAHFMDRMSRSGYRTVDEAAREAAEYVRKYHFDYTDFTPFEKTKMMRVIPFYKWTRKAFPLMAGMIFTQPGKAMIYPKMMQNLSYATGGTDPELDQNGFFPNYEDVTPDWMQDLMTYPIGEDESGAMTYMNVATPQFDIYKMMKEPWSSTLGMLTPFAKVPYEQLSGETMDPDFKMDVKTGEERFDHLARTTPASSLLNNIYDKRGDEDSAISEPGMSPLDERMTSFITGLGFYENNKKRQQGEQMRRNFEGRN